MKEGKSGRGLRARMRLKGRRKSRQGDDQRTPAQYGKDRTGKSGTQWLGPGV
jgi:hypothetical protein